MGRYKKSSFVPLGYGASPTEDSVRTDLQNAFLVTLSEDKPEVVALFVSDDHRRLFDDAIAAYPRREPAPTIAARRKLNRDLAAAGLPPDPLAFVVPSVLIDAYWLAFSDEHPSAIALDRSLRALAIFYGLGRCGWFMGAVIDAIARASLDPLDSAIRLDHPRNPYLEWLASQTGTGTIRVVVPYPVRQTASLGDEPVIRLPRRVAIRHVWWLVAYQFDPEESIDGLGRRDAVGRGLETANRDRDEQSDRRRLRQAIRHVAALLGITLRPVSPGGRRPGSSARRLVSRGRD